MAIILGQTSTNLDVPKYFSTKRTAVPVIKKESLSTDKEFCTCAIQCVPNIKVFTDQVGEDKLKNDFRSFFIRTINSITAVGSTITATITNIDTGDSNTLTDPAFGTLYVGNFYWWFKLDWYKVWLNMGYGRYQVNVKEVGNLFSQTIQDVTYPVYRLCAFSERAANGTVVIDSFNSGKLEHGFDYSNLTTASIPDPFPFEQRSRLPGAFFINEDDQENDRLVLNTPNRPSYQVKDQIFPRYKLILRLLTGKQIAPVLFDELFGEMVLITDYNVFNHVQDPRNYHAEQLIEVPVIRENNSIPEPGFRGLRKTYEFNMNYEYDNVFKTNN